MTDAATVEPGMRKVPHTILQAWVEAVRLGRMDAVWLQDTLIVSVPLVTDATPLPLARLSLWSQTARAVAQQLLAVAESIDEVRYTTPIQPIPRPGAKQDTITREG